MGAFDDLIPQNSPDQKPRSGAFDDLIPDPSAPDAPASLGERFAVNMGEGFEGTLAGQAALNWMNEGNRYQAQADTVREVMRHMADNQMDAAPDTLPNPAQGGPNPEGPDYLGLGEPVQMPGRGTGDLAGMSMDDLASRLSMLEGQATKGQAEFDAERAPVLARREGMPAWHEEDSLLGKAVAGATALGGQLVGGTPSPENLLAFGRGANVAERIARGATGGAAGAGVAEPVVQEGQVRRGERESVDAGDAAIAVAMGAALGGVLNVTPDMVRGVRSLLARRANKPESEVTEADVQAVDPQELLRLSQEASDARSMDPEALGEAITTATGARNDEPQLDPREAAKRRRQTERELGDAFTQTDVLRRDDVDVGEDGISLRDEARPAQDPSGRQADPQTYGFLATAQRVAQENGLTLSSRDLDLAARDIAANDTADPLDVVRSYSQEGRQDAFGQADVQRRRGEDYARDRAGRVADFEAQPEQVQARVRREYAAQGINPDEVAATFTRAARSGDMREVGDLRADQAAESQRAFSRPAFDVAERRRQRREQDLATGENVDNQASDYRAAANPAERAEQRSVSLLDATRGRDGKLTGGESVRVLARSQRQTPDRGVEDMVRVKRDGEQPEWVPATRVTDVETPANPRMAQQAAQETREPPDGVGLERGDSPEGYTASQGSQPRRAVDRMSDPDGLRRGLYESADDQPDPRQPSDASRVEEGQTVEGEATRQVDQPRLEDQARAEGEPDANTTDADEADSTFSPMPREPKPDAEAPGGGGSQLYSGLPVDRMWKSIKGLAGKEAESYRMSAEANAQLLDDARSASGGLRAKNRGTKRNIMSDVWRVTLASLDGDMRVLAGKFNSPTLQSLPDEFHATAGKDSGTGQTFDEAVQARNSRLNEIDRLTEFMQNRKLTSPERQAQIIKLVENPRTPRRGDMGEAAKRIEQYLKAELDYLRKAGVDVGEVRDGYFPREMDVGKAASQPDKFIAAATKAYRSTGLDEADAIASARAYWESTVFGASGKPGVRNQGSGTPSFVQGRVFDKAAAEHLRDFRVSDVDAVLGQYTMRATKRAEIARRFGDNWSRWDEIEQKILSEDPDAQYVLPAMRDRVALSAGTQLDQMSAGARSTLSAMRTWTTLATLPKAAMASLGELVMAPLRGTTGSIPGDLGQATVNILAHLGNFTQTLTGMGRSEKMEAAFEMAEDLGIIAGTGHNSLMAARFAGGDPVGRVQSKVLASFFRRNLLEGLTNYTRVTSMRQGQVFLRRLSRQMERHPERAGYFLRELGVPKGREKDFANWLQGQQSDMPLASEVQGEFAPVYRNALQRFTDQTVMRPSNSTRPKWANHPLGAMVFQLQAFGYAFQKNVINRMGRTGAGLDKLDATAFAASALPSVLLLVGAQGMFRYLRDELYDPDINDRKTPAAFVEGAVSQAGLFGVADPYLQSLTGVRYQKPIWSAFTGPALGGLGDAADDLLAAGLNDSPNTNTAERNLADSVYDWAIEPAMQVALTAAPGGPISGKLATAATVYGAPSGREPFTDMVAGPEDPDKKNPPIQGTIEWLLGTQGGSDKSSDSGDRWGGGSSSSRW